MSTREARLDRGRRRGEELTRSALAQLRSTRKAQGLSQDVLGAALGCSQAEISNLETLRRLNISLRRICEVASLLGLEASLTLHPMGAALRDKGHEKLIGRLLGILDPAWRAFREAPFPNPGDPRSWDVLIRLGAQLVGVEAETGVRDFQALVRRMRDRARTGGAEQLLLVLSDGAANRRVVGELRLALGEDFATSPRLLLRALRTGQPLPGSGVVLL